MREELLQARLQVVREMFAQFEILNTTSSADLKADAQSAIDELTSARSPHSACAQDYLRLLNDDPVRAHLILQLARKSATSIG